MGPNNSTNKKKVIVLDRPKSQGPFLAADRCYIVHLGRVQLLNPPIPITRKRRKK
jgi:hypothetical protein